jgi:hypothetical protein
MYNIEYMTCNASELLFKHKAKKGVVAKAERWDKRERRERSYTHTHTHTHTHT